jgi:isoquinoline 1-oxidoreductase beta subunit
VKRRRLIVSALAAGPALLLGWGLLPPRSRLGGSDALAPLDGPRGAERLAAHRPGRRRCRW